MHKQDKIELEVFNEFADVAQIDIIPGSIQKQKPPKPDIICKTKNHGYLEFELTELIDEDFSKRAALLGDTTSYYRNFLSSNLSDDVKEHFNNQYCNALLHFVFKRNVGFLKRKKFAESIFLALVDQEDQVSGYVLVNDLRFNSVLEEVRIQRGSFKGPIIDVDSFGYLGDPTETTINKKIAKKYEQNNSLHLLAHIDFDLLPPKDIWINTMTEVSALIDQSCFEKLWVFDRAKKEITFTYVKLNS